MSSSKDKFRSSVASRANIGKIGLIGKNFSWAEIADGYFATFVKYVMWLNVSMSDMKLMDEEKSSEYLIADDFDVHSR